MKDYLPIIPLRHINLSKIYDKHWSSKQKFGFLVYFNGGKYDGTQ